MEERDRIMDGRRRDRRAVLGAAAAALTGLVVGGAASPAGAADGDAVRLGRRNDATSPTTIVNHAEGETVVRARASGSGAIALDGVSDHGTGIHGLSQDGNGVSGESVLGTGVSGHSIEPGSSAVSGISTDGVGVVGGSHGGVGVQGDSQYGVAVRGGNVSETEPAIQGWAQNGQTGVMGRSGHLDDFEPIPSPTHVGVFGVADGADGTGVVARSRNGRALRASGRLRFSTSGIAVVPAGAAEVTIAPTFRVMPSAKVLVTPQGDPGNGATVGFVDIDRDANAFTVHMTAAVTAETAVAWFVLD